MTRAPKKSDSLEIRIPFASKTAFMEACRLEGRGASEVLREMIDQRLEARPAWGGAWRKWAIGFLAAAGLAGAALPSLARPGPDISFSQLDRNHDGVLNREEFSALTMKLP